jgi:hypothetical protein
MLVFSSTPIRNETRQAQQLLAKFLLTPQPRADPNPPFVSRSATLCLISQSCLSWAQDANPLRSRPLPHLQAQPTRLALLTLLQPALRPTPPLIPPQIQTLHRHLSPSSRSSLRRCRTRTLWAVRPPIPMPLQTSSSWVLPHQWAEDRTVLCLLLP